MEKIEIILDSIQLIRMSDEEYFSPKYKDYISNSGLGLLNPEQGGSLEAYINGFEEKFSESFELGSAIHCMLLQPGEFIISSFDKPSGKAGLFATNVFKLRQQGYKIVDALSEARKMSDYYAMGISKKILQNTIRKSLGYYLNRLHDTTEGNIIYLSAPIKEKYFSCMKGITKNNELLDLLNSDKSHIETFNEYALFCDIKVTMDEGEVILKVKAKLDNFTLNHLEKTYTLNDLKTTSKPVKFFMGNYIWEIDADGSKKKRWIDGSFQKYHYFRQIGE